MAMLTIAILVVSLLALVKSSDYFVEAGARLAKRFGISELVIGLTIIAIGTSLPELASSALASAHGQTELAVGTIIGSNIANIGLILGFSALVIAVKVDKKALSRDCTVMLGVSLLFWLFASDGSVSLPEGILLAALVPVYLAFLLHFTPRPRKLLREFRSYLPIYVSGFRKLGSLSSPRAYGRLFNTASYKGFSADGPGRDISHLFVMGFCIALSAEYAVRSASEIAGFLGVTQNIIGATIIAAGTSLPELSVSISAVRKGFTDIMLGNIIGSNIFNLVLVAGLAAMISPLHVMPISLALSLPFMALLATVLFVFVKSGRTVKRAAGAGLVALYVLFLHLLIGGGAILPYGIS